MHAPGASGLISGAAEPVSPFQANPHDRRSVSLYLSACRIPAPRDAAEGRLHPELERRTDPRVSPFRSVLKFRMPERRGDAASPIRTGTERTPISCSLYTALSHRWGIKGGLPRPVPPAVRIPRRHYPHGAYLNSTRTGSRDNHLHAGALSRRNIPGDGPGCVLPLISSEAPSASPVSSLPNPAEGREKREEGRASSAPAA